MAGINLSQTENKVAPSFFDTGTIVGAVFLLMTLSVFGGLRWYISSLEKESMALEAQLAEKKSELEGERANRLIDVHSRVSYLAGHMPEDSKEIFAKLESVVLPSVSLSSFSYRRDGNVVSLEAVTDNFKTLAQQLETLRNTGMFQQVQTKEIVRTEDGGLSFALDAMLIASDKK